ncbi:MAG: class I SAM-dependent methyltransferase [Roseiflexus sp.]|nr:class I SAM-dependent methyltransferase [Roseiflexus sp.]
MPFYDHYGDRSATSVGMGWVRAQTRCVLDRLMRALPSASSLLEIGPGRGAFADACRQKHLQYCALDINARLLRDLSKRGHSVVQARATHIPCAGETFDIVFASHVVEHSPGYSEALMFLEGMCRVAKRGGLVAIVAPDYLALREDFWNCDYSHSFVTTQRRLRQMYYDAGLAIIDELSLYGPLTGLGGWVAGQTLGGRVLGQVARMMPGTVGEKLYKLRLTFARAILMIGRPSQ